MKRKNSRRKWESAYLNDRTYIQYYNRLSALAISMFEWKNLPPSVDERFLEYILFADGYAVFFKDEVLDYLTLQCMIGGKLNVYRIPTQRRAYATNGYNKDLTDKDSVIIYNNTLHTNSMLDVEMYARRLYEIERAIDVNVMGQKTPIMIKCTENQRLVLKNLLMNYEGNEPFIFGDKSLDLTGVDVLQTGVPFISPELNALKREIFNEALTTFGISNVNVNKKERLVSDEVNNNMGSINAQRFTRLNARKQACAQINAMFGLNIDVDYREDLIENIQKEELEDLENETKYTILERGEKD